MSHAWFHIENEAEHPSPALLLLSQRHRSQSALMVEIAGGPERLRPHVKTHKTRAAHPTAARLGITKFKCLDHRRSGDDRRSGRAQM
jgi:hypothetical protein